MWYYFAVYVCLIDVYIASIQTLAANLAAINHMLYIPFVIATYRHEMTNQNCAYFKQSVINM